MRIGSAVGIAGAIGMLAGAIAMTDTPGLEVLGTFIALAAIVLAWRLIAHGLRSHAALSSTLTALPAIVSHLEAAPPERALDASMLPIRFTSARWFGILLAFPATIGLLVLASDVTDVIDAASARNHVFAFLFFLPLFGVVLLLLATTRIDATRSDLVITRRVLGVAYARTRVPIEIVRGFSTRAHDRKYSTGLVVDLIPMAAQIEIYSGYGATKAASDLNRLFA